MNTNRITYAEEFGVRLRDLRERAGFSQAGLAALLTVRGRRATQSTITRWESGSVPFAVADLPLMADNLGVTITDLIPLPEAPAPDEAQLLQRRRLLLARADVLVATERLRDAELREQAAQVASDRGSPSGT